MSAFTYTAKRGLISGHSINTVYSFDLKIATYEPLDIIDASQKKTSSQVETIFNGLVSSHRFTTIPLNQTEYLEVREFLLSAMDGHSISFDVAGTVAVPVDVVSGTLKVNKSLQPSQPAHLKYVFTFEIMEL